MLKLDEMCFVALLNFDRKLQNSGPITYILEFYMSVVSGLVKCLSIVSGTENSIFKSN